MIARALLALTLLALCAVLRPDAASAQQPSARCEGGVLTFSNQLPQIVFEDRDMCRRFARPYQEYLRGDCIESMCRGAASRIATINEELETTDIVVIDPIGRSILYRCSADPNAVRQTIPTPQIREAIHIYEAVEVPAGAEIGPVRCPRTR